MGGRVERLPADGDGGRQVVLIDLDNDWQWPVDADLDWFIAFLAVDAVGVPSDRIASLAKAMLGRRCAYVSVWGPESQRVHDTFDRVYETEWSHPRPEAGEWSQDVPFLMSTWHDDESLASGLWFSLMDANPSADGYWMRGHRRSRRWRTRSTAPWFAICYSTGTALTLRQTTPARDRPFAWASVLSPE